MKRKRLVDSANRLPLAVDLDGTLFKTDTFYEGLCELARRNPSAILNSLRAVVNGKAAVKRAISGVAPIDVTAMPYNEDVVEYLRQHKAKGRRIGLFTAADQSIADAVAAHFGCFHVARGSDGRLNLSGARKADAIEGAFGPRFAYVGNHEVDLPIFARAETACLVGPVARLQRKLPVGKVVEATFAKSSSTLRDWGKALRLNHWAKNLLVFVPSILAASPSPLVFLQTFLLFILFGLLASATYLINDLLDLAADRAHPEKRHRPLAAGRVKLRDGMAAAAGLLMGAGVAAALWLPPSVILVLVGYLVLTLAYSLYIKRQPVADVLCLAGLFTSRILAGSYLGAAAPSPWLISFSLLFFLSLAQVKRYSELHRVLKDGGEGIESRGYLAVDLSLLLSTGIGSAFASTVIFAVYLIQEQYPREIYHHPYRLWAMMPVLLGWLLRVWRRAVHGQMNEDPVLFALHDRISLGLVAIIGLILVAAWV
jgi:4-hydroxybenzoate polyprenyltransferase